jgi:vacuolar-type H+-ATPase subunit H
MDVLKKIRETETDLENKIKQAEADKQEAIAQAKLDANAFEMNAIQETEQKNQASLEQAILNAEQEASTITKASDAHVKTLNTKTKKNIQKAADAVLEKLMHV